MHKSTKINLRICIFVLLLMIPATIFSLYGCAENERAQIDIEAEKAAILETIATETEAYFRQDYELWKEQFVDAPYFMRIGFWEGYPNKVSYHQGFDTLRTEKKLQFEEDATQWAGSEQTRENLQFRIYDEAAWVTFDQVSVDSESGEELGRSKEIKILEKIEGEWRLAYIGFYYLP